MDLNAEVDQLVKASQTWLPMIMEYGSRLLLALLTLAIGWWVINKVTYRLANCWPCAMPTWPCRVLSAAWPTSF